MTGSGRNIVSRATQAAGFTLVEVLVITAIVAILAGMTVPSIASAMRLFAVNSSVQAVGAAVRDARYTAVSKNRTMRVLFNCPAADQFRIVEVTGNAAIDNDANRCSEAAYPASDPDPAVRPNLDGPIIRLPSETQFGALSSIEIDTAGRVQRLTGCPACVVGAAPVTVAVVGTYGATTRTITVTANGQVLTP